MSSKHLTSEQILDRLSRLDDRNRDLHLEQCPECRKEVERMARVLGEFRTAVHAWGADVFAFRRSSAYVARPPAKPGWPALALTLVFLLCLALAWPTTGRKRIPSASADSALLNQVDANVVRTVPGPMEPLAGLLSWEQPATESGPAQLERQ